MAKHKASRAERWAARTDTQRKLTLARLAADRDPHLADFNRAGAYQFAADERTKRIAELDPPRHRAERTRTHGFGAVRAALGRDVRPT